MKQYILPYIFIFCTTAVFAQNEQQNAEISELAKQYAEAVCTCPSQDFMKSITLDFKNKKISQEELNQGLKMVGVEMMQCTRQFHNQIQSFSADEYTFFKSEMKKYTTEFYANQKTTKP